METSQSAVVTGSKQNLVKDGDLLVDSHNILNRWKRYFPQLLNLHSVCDVRQIEIHIIQPLVPGSSPLEVEIAIAKLKTYKTPWSGQILAGMIQTESRDYQNP
jgi:hypothetical protein